MKKEDFAASDTWFCNFLKRNKLSIRKKTHVVQKLKENYEIEVENYFDKIRKHLQSKNDLVSLNFDETNIPFDLSRDQTIEETGSKEITLLTHAKSKLTCTVAPCISSEGDCLLPMLIFKYKHKSRNFPKKYEGWIYNYSSCFARFTDSGFNNQQIMGEYLEVLLKKASKLYPDKKIILILDTAPCHYGKEIEEALVKYLVDVIYIPGGCTSFLQPI